MVPFAVVGLKGESSVTRNGKATRIAAAVLLVPKIIVSLKPKALEATNC